MTRGVNINTRTKVKASEVSAIVVLDNQGKYRPLTIQELKQLLDTSSNTSVSSSPTGNNSTVSSLATPGIWITSDGWANGSPFNNGWSKNNAVINNEILTLSITNAPSSGKPFTSGEYRTIQPYSYGYYETRMKPLKSPGTMTGYFLYAHNAQYQRICEIDIEFLGSNTNQIRCTYWLGEDHYEKFIDLTFDASLDFHTYAIDWQKNSIKWYVDGNLIYTDTGSRSGNKLPNTPSQVMMNLWTGDANANSWMGTLDTTKLPLTAQFSDFKLYPY